jgi:hypothetical protein
LPQKVLLLTVSSPAPFSLSVLGDDLRVIVDGGHRFRQQRALRKVKS